MAINTTNRAAEAQRKKELERWKAQPEPQRMAELERWKADSQRRSALEEENKRRRDLTAKTYREAPVAKGSKYFASPDYRRRYEEEKAAVDQEIETGKQRQGLSAEDYWERNPEAKRTAVNSRGETVDVMDLARGYQKSQAERADHEARIAAMRVRGQQLAQARGGRPVIGTQEYIDETDRLEGLLRQRGVNPEKALSKEDDSSSFSVDKARGLLTRSTFDSWEDDKRFAEQAKRMDRESRSQLRGLRNYRDVMGSRMGPEESQRLTSDILALEQSIQNGRNNPGYWRRKVEESDAAAKERNRAQSNIARANQTTAASMEQNRETLNEMIREMLKNMSNGGTPEQFDKLSQLTATLTAIGGAPK